MSLNWDVREVRTDLESGSQEREEWWQALDWDKFQSMVFNTMTLGINRITEQNYEKFYSRYVQYYFAKGYSRFYDLSFVREMIGLRTNASVMTDAQFKKDLIEVLEEHANQALKAER